MDFPAGKRIWSWERAGFVFSSKEKQFRWLCLETQEGGKKEGKGERMGPGVTAIGASQAKLAIDQMSQVCTPHMQLNTHKQTHVRTHTHTSTPKAQMCTQIHT